MIVRARGGNYERRSVGWPDYTRPPAWSSLGTWEGITVTTESALGLPAVSAAVRLVAETIASLPLQVFRGRRADKRLAENTPQFKLLQQPNDEQSQLDFISDIAASVETVGNAFVEKTKVRGQVVAMHVLNSSFLRLTRDRDSGQKVFEVTYPSRRKLSTAQVIHVRGFTIDGSMAGLSPVALHRRSLGIAVALDEFSGRFFTQGANPGGAIQVAGPLNETQRDSLLAAWEARHGGLAGAHRPALLVNGATWVQTGLSLEDAQFVESRRLGVKDVARIWRVPASLLEEQEGDASPTAEQEFLRFHLGLLPRLRRIELALYSDPDLFGAGRDPYPEFDVSQLLRTDAATRAEVQHKQIQSGMLLVDEARAEEGRQPLHVVNPSLPDNIGLTPQIVPVGGSPAGIPVVGNGQPT